MSYPPNPPGQQPGDPSFSAPSTDPTYIPPQPGPPTDPQGWSAQPGTTAQQPVFDAGQTPVYDPTSGQPVYAAPTEQQPAYYQQPPASGGGSKAALWIALAVVLVVLLGGGATAAILLNNKDDKTATTQTPGSGVTPTNTGSVPTQGPPASTVSLDSPTSIGGYNLATDPSLTGLLESAKGQMGALGANATDTVYAIYQDSSDESKIAMVIALAQPQANPEIALSGVFTGFASGLGSDPTSVKDVSPGPLGGAAKCATSTASGQDIMVCGWADEGSFGMVIFFGDSPPDSEASFLQFRSAVETKS